MNFDCKTAIRQPKYVQVIEILSSHKVKRSQNDIWISKLIAFYVDYGHFFP